MAPQTLPPPDSPSIHNLRMSKLSSVQAIKKADSRLCIVAAIADRLK